MTTQSRTPLFVSTLMTALLVTAASAQTQNPLAAARELYAAAAYDEALTMLDNLPANGMAVDADTAGLYRALCLFALGRENEANGVIGGIIQNNPRYRPSADDVPPRIQAAFTTARRRLLPVIVQQEYNNGKAAYDRQDYTIAARVFKQVLDDLSDADMSAAANQPPLADLRTLALGFYTLSDKAAAPPPAPVPAPSARRPIQSIYTGEEPDVTPPVVVRQKIPPFVGKVMSSRAGVVEVIVNEIGTIDAARITVPLDPSYDERVLSAAKDWTYKPATVDGTPVKFLRRVRVILTQSQ
jgi:hypothetical protein